jgi:uncharacterized metal-binding protein
MAKKDKVKGESLRPDCAACALPKEQRICVNAAGKPSAGCPTLFQKQVLDRANAEYADPAIGEFAYQASVQEAEAYANRHQVPYVMQPCKTRIVEICEFAQRMGYTRLGLAFCMGLRKEAAVVSTLLQSKGFDVVSVVCKAGRTSKSFLGISEEHLIQRGTDESMCNPIFQAKGLNEARTHFNILLGLCVGHDSLFFKYAEAPTTVLAVKDRVTGHNPLAAIYNIDSYYCKLSKLP